jgi:hypothetical protein
MDEKGFSRYLYFEAVTAPHFEAGGILAPWQRCPAPFAPGGPRAELAKATLESVSPAAAWLA